MTDGNLSNDLDLIIHRWDEMPQRVKDEFDALFNSADPAKIISAVEKEPRIREIYGKLGYAAFDRFLRNQYLIRDVAEVLDEITRMARLPPLQSSEGITFTNFIFDYLNVSPRIIYCSGRRRYYNIPENNIYIGTKGLTDSPIVKQWLSIVHESLHSAGERHTEEARKKGYWSNFNMDVYSANVLKDIVAAYVKEEAKRREKAEEKEIIKPKVMPAEEKPEEKKKYIVITDLAFGEWKEENLPNLNEMVRYDKGSIIEYFSVEKSIVEDIGGIYHAFKYSDTLAEARSSGLKYLGFAIVELESLTLDRWRSFHFAIQEWTEERQKWINKCLEKKKELQEEEKGKPPEKPPTEKEKVKPPAELEKALEKLKEAKSFVALKEIFEKTPGIADFFADLCTAGWKMFFLEEKVPAELKEVLEKMKEVKSFVELKEIFEKVHGLADLCIAGWEIFFLEEAPAELKEVLEKMKEVKLPAEEEEEEVPSEYEESLEACTNAIAEAIEEDLVLPIEGAEDEFYVICTYWGDIGRAGQEEICNVVRSLKEKEDLLEEALEKIPNFADLYDMCDAAGLLEKVPVKAPPPVPPVYAPPPKPKPKPKVPPAPKPKPEKPPVKIEEEKIEEREKEKEEIRNEALEGWIKDQLESVHPEVSVNVIVSKDTVRIEGTIKPDHEKKFIEKKFGVVNGVGSSHKLKNEFGELLEKNRVVPLEDIKEEFETEYPEVEIFTKLIDGRIEITGYIRPEYKAYFPKEWIDLPITVLGAPILKDIARLKEEFGEELDQRKEKRIERVRPKIREKEAEIIHPRYIKTTFEERVKARVKEMAGEIALPTWEKVIEDALAGEPTEYTCPTCLGISRMTGETPDMQTLYTCDWKYFVCPKCRRVFVYQSPPGEAMLMVHYES